MKHKIILASVAHRDEKGRRCDRVAARSCEAWVVALRTLFNFFGFKEAIHKYEPPSRKCEWLGLAISSVTGRVTIPNKKAAGQHKKRTEEEQQEQDKMKKKKKKWE